MSLVSTSPVLQSSPAQVSQEAVAGDVALTSTPDQQGSSSEYATGDDGNTSCADKDDVSGHGGVGDDSVSTLALAFFPDSMRFAPALRHDEGSPPPFLPPAGRPPRV